MKASQLADYARVHARLVAAQEEHAAASAQMDALEQTLREEINAAQQANQQAIAEAETALLVAKQRLAEARATAGATARQRWLDAGGVGLAFLTDDEQGRVDEAAAAVHALEQTRRDAHAGFKAGVTPDQLEAVASVEPDPEPTPIPEG